jgi:hypothetical protein
VFASVQPKKGRKKRSGIGRMMKKKRTNREIDVVRWNQRRIGAPSSTREDLLSREQSRDAFCCCSNVLSVPI